MALFNEAGIPKSRPEPQGSHVDAFEEQARRERAIRIVMTRENVGWNEATKLVDEAGHESILAKHDTPAASVPAPQSLSQQELHDLVLKQQAQIEELMKK